MKILDILGGTGTLEVEGDVHAVRYDLALLADDRGVAQFRGALGGDYGALHQAFDRGHAVLVIDGGVRIPLVVTRLDGRTAVVLSVGAPAAEGSD